MQNTFNTSIFFPVHLLPEGHRTIAMNAAAGGSSLLRVDAAGELFGDIVAKIGAVSPSTLLAMGQVIGRAESAADLKGKFLTIPTEASLPDAIKEWDNLTATGKGTTNAPTKPTSATLDTAAIYAARRGRGY